MSVISPCVMDPDMGAANLPHACEKLDETAVAKRKGNNDARRRNIARVHVDAREHKRGEGESAEAKRRRVGELALLCRCRPPETGLELTTKGGQPRLIIVVDVGHRVPGIVATVVARVVHAIGVGRPRRVAADVLLARRRMRRVGHCGVY